MIHVKVLQLHKQDLREGHQHWSRRNSWVLTSIMEAWWWARLQPWVGEVVPARRLD